jgi:antitoxin MazE
VDGERVINTTIRDERLTLEQRLACFDPERHGGDAMSDDKALVAERW